MAHELNILLVDRAIQPQGFPVVGGIGGRGLLRHQESRRITRGMHEQEDDYADHRHDDSTLNQAFNDKSVHPSHRSHISGVWHRTCRDAHWKMVSSRLCYSARKYP